MTAEAPEPLLCEFRLPAERRPLESVARSQEAKS